ncbi:MAG: S9 family peptidase, partial [Chloroflexi bacterium]|nr:S9 family peptidase [Chloroflexota bacterium]
AFLRKPGGPPAPAPDAGAEAASRFAGLGLGGPGAGPRFPDQPQVYLLDLSGGEAARLTDLPLGAGAPVWLPDGRLGFSAPLLAQAPTLAGTAALAAERAKDPVSARVTEDRVYRFWDRWLTEGRVEHILLLDLADDRLIDLTPGWTRWLGLSEGGRAFAAAPDSGEIAFEACRSTPPHSPLVFGVYRQAVPARGASAEGLAEPRLLHPEHPGPAMRPRYSPDGAWIVYGLQREIGFYADPVRLMAFERASGRHRPLTEAWDNSAESWTFGADATRLLLVAQEGAHNAVWAIDLAAVEAPADHPPRVLARGGWLGEPRPVGPRLCCSHQSLTEPPELALLDLETGRPERLTRFTEPAMADLALGAVEEVFFAGAEGDRVQMYLVHPPELPADPGPAGVASGTAGGRQPGARGRSLVHLVHGGPHGVFGDQWHWRWNAHAFAARGHLVALVNFHGSTGFGEAYTRSILGQWGARPAADLQAATDWLIAERGVDPARMAIAGGSYGGYLVSWLAGETDRFACIVNHAGVSDFQTQFASDITQGRRKSMGGELWEDLAGLDRFNPIRRAASFRSPMLVIHGEKDYRVPYNQGLVIYNVYQARGLPARLVVYADENHWILKPRNSRHWYGEVLDWIERWLGGQALYSAGAAADSTGGP